MNLANKTLKAKVLQKVVTTQAEETQFLANISPVQGDSYISTTSGNAVLKVYDGSKWVDNEVDLSDKLDANGLSTEVQSDWGSSQNQSSSVETTKIKRNSKTILNLNTEDNVTGYSNESGWHITPNVINSSQSFSDTFANVYLKSTSTDGVVGVATQKNLPENEVFMEATFEGDGVHFTSGGAGQAATLDITRDSVKRNDKTETWENILNAPSKIGSKADLEYVTKAVTALTELIDDKQYTLVSGTNIKTINGKSVLGEGNIEVTSTVDTELSNTSENAVQNKVVKAAIDGKLDKLTTSGRQKVYAHTGATQNEINVGVANEAGIIPLTDNYGRLYISDSAGQKKGGYAVNTIDIDNATQNKIYEANLKWGGKNFKGSYGCLDAAMIPTLGADRFRGISVADAITIEYSRDGGTTWTDFGVTDEQKKKIFSDDDPVNPVINIGKATTGTEITADYKLRVIIDIKTAHVYTELNKFALYVSTNGSQNCTCTIDSTHLQDTTDNYDVVHAQDIPIGGWAGWNIINIPLYTFGGYAQTQSWYRRKLRFTFSIGSHTDTAYTGLRIVNIKAFGGVGWSTPSNEAHYRSPFRYDGSKYIADRPFNFTSDIQAAGKQLATKEYVDSKSSSVTVVDNLTSTSTTSALSANQGKVLNDKLDLKYDLASGVGLNDYDVSVISENGDLMSDVYAGNISVTQVNGSSGLSGGIKINNSVPTLYSGSKSETIENIIDGVSKVANKYDKVTNISIENSKIEVTDGISGVFTESGFVNYSGAGSKYVTGDKTTIISLDAGEGNPEISYSINGALSCIKVKNLKGVTAGYDFVTTYNPSWSSNNGVYFCQVNYVVPLNADSAIRKATLSLPNPSTGTTETGTFKFKYTPDVEGVNASLDYYVFTNGYALLVCNPTNLPMPESGSGVIPWTRYADGLYDGIVLIYNSSWASATTITDFNPIGTLGNTVMGIRGSGTITFDEPLVLPKKYDKIQRMAVYGDPTNYYTYTEHPDGSKECEIAICANSASPSTTWGGFKEASLGSFSFKSGFFDTDNIHMTITPDSSSACWIPEFGNGVVNKTSTGNIWVMRGDTTTISPLRVIVRAWQV